MGYVRSIAMFLFIAWLKTQVAMYIRGGSYQIIDLRELCFGYIFLPSSEACRVLETKRKAIHVPPFT